jgi:hypothetical protein
MEESDNILGHLRGRSRSTWRRKEAPVRMTCDIWDTIPTIFVFDHAIKKDTCHGYSAAGEEWIIVHSIADFDTSRGVDVAGKKGEDVITTAMTGFDDQA